MTNPRNNGTLVGRLARDPYVFDNPDGSKKVTFSVYVDRDYKDSQNNRPSDPIPVEAFVRAKAQGLGPFGHIHRGDLVALAIRLRHDHYTDKDGKDVYALKVEVEDLTFLEPRTVTQARLADRVQAAETANQELQARVPAPREPQPVAASAVDAQPFG